MMRLKKTTGLGLLAVAAATVGALAPSASAEAVCQTVGKDRLRSTVCVVVTGDESSTTVAVGCSLHNDFGMCAINPVTVPIGVGPISSDGG